MNRGGLVGVGRGWGGADRGWKVLGGVGWDPKGLIGLEGVRRGWMRLEGVGRGWKRLEGVGMDQNRSE